MSTANQGERGNVAKKPRITTHPPLPKSDDEPPRLLKLMGSFCSGNVELSGWSPFVPTKLFNIHESNKFTDMTDKLSSTREFVTAAKELLNDRITLAELESLVNNQRYVIRPVHVQVVAKRKVDILISKNKILILPILVIADETGYCVLNSFNEGFHTVYNAVDVGDNLLLSRYGKKAGQRMYHESLFPSDNCLNLEIKIQFNSVRTHFLDKFHPASRGRFLMRETLFPSNDLIKFPSELMQHEQRVSFPKYFDVVGIINYVSRIQRYNSSNEPFRVEGADGKQNELDRFVSYRWISIFDETSRPVFIKIYVHTKVECQSALVPGAVVVISHCRLTPSIFFGEDHVTTSEFSDIFIEDNVQKFFYLRPPSFAKKCMVLLRRSNFVMAIARPDIVFSVGGNPSFKVSSAEHLVGRHNTLSASATPFERPVKRRESKYLTFKGMIYRVLLLNETSVNVIYTRPGYSEALRKQKQSGQPKTLETFKAISWDRHLNWYTYRRKLPPIAPEALEEDQTRKIVKNIVQEYKKYCGPLLMPVEIEKDNRNLPAFPPMADLELLDGPPLLQLDVVDELKGSWYSCWWMPGAYTFEEIWERVELAKEKTIICLGEAFCIEEGYLPEACIHDMTVADN